MDLKTFKVLLGPLEAESSRLTLLTLVVGEKTGLSLSIAGPHVRMDNDPRRAFSSTVVYMGRRQWIVLSRLVLG